MNRRFFTLLAVALGPGACGQPQDQLAENEKLLPTTCYVPYPSPVELSMATEPLEDDSRLEKMLQRDLPAHGQVFEFSPDTQKLAVELKKGSYLPRRLFFVIRSFRRVARRIPSYRH